MGRMAPQKGRNNLARGARTPLGTVALDCQFTAGWKYRFRKRNPSPSLRDSNDSHLQMSHSAKDLREPFPEQRFGGGSVLPHPLPYRLCNRLLFIHFENIVLDSAKMISLLSNQRRSRNRKVEILVYPVREFHTNTAIWNWKWSNETMAVGRYFWQHLGKLQGRKPAQPFLLGNRE